MDEQLDDKEHYVQQMAAAYETFRGLVQRRLNQEENGKLHQTLRDDVDRLNAIERVLFVLMAYSDLDLASKMWYLQVGVELAFMLGYETAQAESKLTSAEALIKSALKEL